MRSSDITLIVFAACFWLTAGAAEDPRLKPLTDLVQDNSPRVRLEALRALAKIPSAKSAELALTVLDKPMDPFLDYALWLTINDLADPWIAAIKSGEWKVEGHEKQLEFGLKSIEPEKASMVLGQLLQNKPLPRDGAGAWIELIGRAGGAKELQRLFDQVLANGFDAPAAVRALTALNEASRLRNTRPPSGIENVGKLFDSSSEKIRGEALRLAGTWKDLKQFFPQLVSVAGASGTPPALRQIAFDSLREIGGPGAIAGLLPLCGAETPLAIRQKAVLALAVLDLRQATPLAAAILAATPDENGALELWRPLLNVKGAAGSLARALPASGFPAPSAKAGLRAAREGGRNEPELVLALTRSAGLDDAELTLTAGEIQQIAASVAQGDSARGEKVFRRPELGCVTCHAIGGVGGKVGPDLTSIGASAPVDYLVESLFYPNRKIKEGYHAVVLETQDGQELSGVLVRENTEQLVVRDVSNREVSLAKSSIKNRTMGGSLMPSGLIDNIGSQDRIDLFRFLSELGKPGPYDASKGGVARYWRVLPALHTSEQFGLDKIVGSDMTGGDWQTVYSLVDGRLLREDIQNAMRQNKYAGLVGIFLGAKFQVATEGVAHFKLSDAPGASVWIDGKALDAKSGLSAQLGGGAHSLILRLEPTKLPDHVRLESGEATFLTN